MKEVRHANAVYEVPDVRGGRSADVVVRNARDDRRHAREQLDRAEGIAEREAERLVYGADSPYSRQPEIATSWAESIVDPRLRVRVLATIVNEWAAVDLSSARNYALTSPRIRPEDRPGVLAAFEPGFKPIALAP